MCPVLAFFCYYILNYLLLPALECDRLFPATGSFHFGPGDVNQYAIFKYINISISYKTRTKVWCRNAEVFLWLDPYITTLWGNWSCVHRLTWCVVAFIKRDRISPRPPPPPPPPPPTLLFLPLPWCCFCLCIHFVHDVVRPQCISSRPPAVTTHTERHGWSTVQRLSQDGCLTPTVRLMLRFSCQFLFCLCLHSVSFYFSPLQVCMSSSACPLIPAVLLFISSPDTNRSLLHLNFNRPETALNYVSTLVP